MEGRRGAFELIWLCVCSPIGSLYRDVVLAPHRSRPSLESLTIFLGRPPSVDAFVRLKGWRKA